MSDVIGSEGTLNRHAGDASRQAILLLAKATRLAAVVVTQALVQ